MASIRKSGQGGSHFAVTVLIAAGISTVLSIILSMIIAAVVVNGGATETSTAYFVYAALLSAGFAGTMYGCKRVEGKYAVICIAIVAVFLFELITANIVFFEGTFQRMGVSIAAIIVGGALACYICTVGKGRKSRRKVRVK